MEKMYSSIKKFLWMMFLTIYIQAYNMPSSRSTENNQTPDSEIEIIQPIQISLQERADTLMFLYEKIQKSKDTNSLKEYKSSFLKLFPHSFSLLNSIYGYDDETGPRFLYYESDNHIELFFNLESINKDAFINKVIEVSINGHWEADAINYFRMGMKENFLKNPLIYYDLLSNYSQSDILSFWHFFFDGPHPKNYEDLFKELYSKGNNINRNIAELMQKAYSQLLSGDNCHGH